MKKLTSAIFICVELLLISCPAALNAGTSSKRNLYVAHYGMRQVEVIHPNGRVIRRYASGNLTTSNCAFYAPNLAHLFVTGGLEEGGKGGILRLELCVPGLNICPK